jgi:diguanylate cyclase (GGDEF)-like protein
MYSEVHDTRIASRAAAPAIGRLLSLYERACDAAGGLPRHAGFGQDALARFRDDLMVLRPLGGEAYDYVHYGQGIARYADMDRLGRGADRSRPARGEAALDEIGAFFRACYARARRDRRPLYAIHRGGAASDVHLWERLILVTIDEDGSDLLMVFATPREYLAEVCAGVFESTPNGVMVLRAVRDDEGAITDAVVILANRRASRLMARNFDAPNPVRVSDLFRGSREGDPGRDLIEAIRTRNPTRVEIDLVEPAPARWLRLNAAPLGDGAAVIVEDITEFEEIAAALAIRNSELAAEIKRREAVERELNRLARTDSLTGLANVRAFEERAASALRSAERYNQPFVVVAIDLDHFKTINDRYGHAAGDEVLVELGRILAANTRRNIDIAARLGGEEFFVLMPQTEHCGGVAFAERMRQEIRNHRFTFDGQPLSATASLGVAEWVAGETVDATMARADAALYRAKNGGRDRVVAAEGSCPEASVDEVVTAAE